MRQVTKIVVYVCSAVDVDSEELLTIEAAHGRG